MLYEVTSSYREGEHNELAAYGYHRDGQRGKPHIVIGLLTADDGEPFAMRVFEGNTADPSPVAEPMRVLQEPVGVKGVGLVADRGKAKQALSAEGGKYLTALTDAQIRARLQQGVLQPELFEAAIAEGAPEGKRLVRRRHEAVRHREVPRREDKLARWRALLEERHRLGAGSARARRRASNRSRAQAAPAPVRPPRRRALDDRHGG